MASKWTLHWLSKDTDDHERFSHDPIWHWARNSQPTEPDGAAAGNGRFGPYLLDFRDRTEFETFLKEADEALAKISLEQSKSPDADVPKFSIPHFFRSAAVRESRASKEVSVVAMGRRSTLEALSPRTLRSIQPTGAPLKQKALLAFDGADGDPFGPVPDPFPEKVVIIVDSGFGFAHDRFRRADGSTRLAWYWDQDADAPLGSPVGFGREMYADDIGAYTALVPSNFGEELLYGRYRRDSYAGGVSGARVLPAFGHGSHVMDIAAGEDPGSAGSEAPIALFAVQLPHSAVAATHGFFLFGYVFAGIERALERVAAMKERADAELGKSVALPAVYLNFSFGGNSGRHDGLSRFEQYLDGLVQSGQIEAVTLPVGNTYDQKTHARFKDTDLLAGERWLDWRIQPDDGTASFAQLFLPQTVKAEALELEITPPSGLAPFPPGPGTFPLVPGTYWELTDGRDVLARLYVQVDKGFPIVEPRVRLTLAVRHTARFRKPNLWASGRPDLAGTWRIVPRSVGKGFPSGTELMCWVERDDALPIYGTGARQSYFEEHDDEPGKLETRMKPTPDPNALVRNDGTISDIATGSESIVAAGHRMSNLAPADYSSEGFDWVSGTGGAQNSHPTVSAASDESRTNPGLLGAGNFSGSVRRLAGTSSAAPLVIRYAVSRHDLRPAAITAREDVMNQATLAEPAAATVAGAESPTRIGAGRLTSAIPPRTG